jgi:large subunit ribosomal protein L23
MSLNNYDIFKSHLITEKSSAFEEHLNKYTFIVLKGVDKNKIKKAFEVVFETKVSKVNIINYKSTSRVFKGVKGKTSGFKKAIVTLEKNHTIKNLLGV